MFYIRKYICVLVDLIIYLSLIQNVLSENKRESKFLVDLLFPNPYIYEKPIYSPKPITNYCECGLENNINNNTQLRIINGTEISYHRYPWLAMLLYQNMFICGGSLISDRYVLTAGHCMKNEEFDRNNLKVVLGQHDQCTANSDTIIFSVSDIVRHSKFNGDTFAYDIMLLRLNMRVLFSSFIAPICLPSYAYYNRYGTSVLKGMLGLIVGWGDTVADNDSSISCMPREVPVPILGKSDCPDTASTLFCAGYLNGVADSCQGDSGGPLQVRNKHGRYEIIGITSTGEGCAEVGNAGLYTDILQFIPWIYSQIADSSSCWNYPYRYNYITY